MRILLLFNVSNFQPFVQISNVSMTVMSKIWSSCFVKDLLNYYEKTIKWFPKILNSGCRSSNVSLKIKNSKNCNSLSFGFYLNCGGIKSKLINLKYNVVCFDYIFFVLTKTWLNNDIANMDGIRFKIFFNVIGIVLLVFVLEVVESFLAFAMTYRLN